MDNFFAHSISRVDYVGGLVRLELATIVPASAPTGGEARLEPYKAVFLPLDGFLNSVLDKGLVDDGHHLFRTGLRCRKEACPEACCWEHSFTDWLRHPQIVTRRVVGSITFEPSP